MRSKVFARLPSGALSWPKASASLVAIAMLTVAMPAAAQLATPDPAWKETQAPLPTSFKLTGLIPLDMPPGALQFGIDPGSVSLAADGIVRYVVVASSATGAVNAIYEGIRCSAGEVKVYARHNQDSGWTTAQDATWRPLHDNHPSRHSLTVARTGACLGHGPNRSADQIVRDLKASVDRRFSGEAR